MRSKIFYKYEHIKVAKCWIDEEEMNLLKKKSLVK